MAQSRSSGAEEETINQLQEQLAELLQVFAQATREKTAADDEAPHILKNSLVSENLHENIAPYFISAKNFLKHVLNENKKATQSTKKELYDVLQISHAAFNQLPTEEKGRYLLHICFICDALLQDLSILASQYMIELELCLNRKMIKDIIIEAAVNGISTILMDKALYHFDHQKEFASYRRELYVAILPEDLTTQEFFALMQGHIATAIQFVTEQEAFLKLAVREARPLTDAIKLTLLSPPVKIEAVAANEPVVALTSRFCNIL